MSNPNKFCTERTVWNLTWLEWINNSLWPDATYAEIQISHRNAFRFNKPVITIRFLLGNGIESDINTWIGNIHIQFDNAAKITVSNRNAFPFNKAVITMSFFLGNGIESDIDTGNMEYPHKIPQPCRNHCI